MFDLEFDRLLYVHIAQIGLSLILCCLFQYYYRHYKRPFLKWWSFSWASLTLFYFFTILLITAGFKLGSLGSLLFSYLQLVFLVVGVNEFTKHVRLQKQLVIGILIATLIAAISYFSFINDPDGSSERYILRVGLRSLIMALGYWLVAIKILYHKSFQRSFSKYFLVGAFALYGIQNIWHCIIVYSNVYGEPLPFPIASFGIIDLFSLSVIGIGMIMWLLDNQQSQLLQTNKELDNFLYSTSHDLRAPIASLLGLTNLGKMEVKDQNTLEFFDRIESRVKKLDSIVSDILNYSKSSKRVVSKEKIDFKETVEEIFTQLKFSTSDKINLLVDNGSKKYFYSDPVQLHVILSNLISNAIKYADFEKDLPEIRVKFLRKKENITISVIDNGIGIEAKSLPHVFDMFYRATNKGEGSGLGLFIAKEALNKLNGTFHVTSVEGEGSNFSFSLNENWI